MATQEDFNLEVIEAVQNIADLLDLMDLQVKNLQGRVGQLEAQSEVDRYSAMGADL